jgi:heme/copper-type cytochrome/quinol oxidase subunit 2
MIISKLMNKQIVVTLLLLTIAVQAQTDPNSEVPQKDITDAQAWGFGILTGAGLSIVGVLAAVLIVCVRTCMSEEKFKVMINLLYALGCGAMVGDAMVHILPDAYRSEATNPNFVSLVFIAAVCVFIIIERMFVFCGIVHKHWGD